MQLILTSSSFSSSKIWELFKKAVTENNYKTAVIVPTAHQQKEVGFWYKETEKQLKSVGLETRFIDFEKGEKIDEADVVYVGGGNTFHLMNYAKDSDLGAWLKKDKGLYVGSSAGSVILSPTIEIAKYGDKNQIGLKDLSGFGVVDFEFYPHYTEQDESDILDYEKKQNTSVERVPNGSGIFVDTKDKGVIRL